MHRPPGSATLSRFPSRHLCAILIKLLSAGSQSLSSATYNLTFSQWVRVVSRDSIWSVSNLPGPSCWLPVFCSSLWSLLAALSSWEPLDEPGVPTGLVSAFLPQNTARSPQVSSRLPLSWFVSLPLLAPALEADLFSATFLSVQQVFGRQKLCAWVHLPSSPESQDALFKILSLWEK